MKPENFTATLIRRVLNSSVPLTLLLLSVVLGAIALSFTAREEEPQIVVPMIDVLVSVPSANAKQVERLVTTPIEKLLAQIPGVEHVYSSSMNGNTMITLRFFVGENREQAILNTYNKLNANADKIPTIVENWLIRPMEVDDVPMMMLGLWSDNADLVNDYELRRIAQEVSTLLQRIEHTSEVNVVGGRKRAIEINLEPEKMSARNTSISDVLHAIKNSNTLKQTGDIILSHQRIVLESGDLFRHVNELANVPVNVFDGQTVILKDIANIEDGPEEVTSYSWIDFTPRHSIVVNNNLAPNNVQDLPLVTLSIAKQKGSNAVDVAQSVHQKLSEIATSILPKHVHVEVLRDYGATANEKVNNLASSLVFAIFTVVVFIGVFLGWRAAIVVGLAVPICYGFTLALDLAFGYTINRVTLFALILSLGLLVDDPITGVDNIERYLKKTQGTITDRIVAAINEIRVPLLLSTLTIVLAFVPLAFITGMMGPYMAPMAFNVPVSVISSTLVAFLITPWLASKFLKPAKQTDINATTNNSITNNSTTNNGFERLYSQLLSPFLNDRKKAKWLLWLVLALFIGAAILPVLRFVPLKLLPFDNKNELQILVEMPEFSTLESTAAKAKQIATTLQNVPEITAVASYTGISSPIDFNGLVRQYYMRSQAYQADLRVLLLDKNQREHQSHAVVLKLRELLAPLAKDGVLIKVVEVPPGPPVLSTLVAELYGDEFTPYSQLENAANIVQQRLSLEPHVVEIDSSVMGEQQRLRFITDKTKAALSGISTSDINHVLSVANQGEVVSFFPVEEEAEPLALILKLPLTQRNDINDLKRLAIKGQLEADSSLQPLVALGELGTFEISENDKPIFHKDLKPVVYVTADLSGRTPAEVISDVNADLRTEQKDEMYIGNSAEKSWQSRSFLSAGGGISWQLPQNINLVWGGEGEWRITVRVFRDMGLAFAFALVAIYIVLRIQTASAALSLIIMSAIPLTVIGIMPGFWLLNQFGERTIAGAPDPVLFTATAMIGMIALAGIVVRNSLILVEFITQARNEGATIKEALLQAGAVRMRPVLLTAGTTLLGNLIITLDPVFSGLAIAIIFGIISSTIFTLFVVPIVYLLVFGKEQPNESAKELIHE